MQLADHAAAPPAAPGTRALTVKLMQPADMARWDAFVAACPEATFFHRAGWQTIIDRVYGHKTWFYYAERDGHIVGILCLAEVKSRLFGHSLASLPFCVLGGVAATDDAARPMLDAAAEKLARELNVGHLEYRNLSPAHPGDASWYQKELYVTFRKEISADDETNMNAIPRKQRAMVRKGIKCGLRAVVEDNVDRFFTAYSVSVHRLGTPVFSKKYFAVIKEVFGEECEIRVILRGDELIAGVMSFYWRDEVLPYYGGSLPAARECAGNDFMYWNLMQYAASRGVRIFDFGRSKRGTGAFDFKKNWGFEPTQLAYEYKLIASTELPDNNPLNPKYQLFIKMWKKLPLPVANFLGPFIVRSLG
ncbi:FemAB family PEP-CTERM system-associated protein [Pseudoduganella ginsengisoli]|uniref:FemAB family PEP-CTERM system-associated protein n=1 Tax=Pseudoduganella ginsengisoli TaxID=1462440 RepID=A0A6L6PZZ3_9BURK|nr:FemAB family XrtA/PEP-CTERM system-associated protein [Pseudoduganella ginsengisoli]MTW02578.1 FemAB family PEP-CTERM system-associated protein [Pseudoduganella ginsengisoli]